MPHKDSEKRRRYQHEYYLRRKAEDYEGIKQRNRESYGRNKSTVLARTGRYYQENKERHAKWMRAWWRRRKESLREYRRKKWQEWAEANPDKVRAIKARRAAHKKNASETLTPKEAKQLWEAGQAMYPGEELHLDHIVPLSRGGGTTMANMQAIPASLNLSKHNKLPQEVYQQLFLGGGHG